MQSRKSSRACDPNMRQIRTVNLIRLTYGLVESKAVPKWLFWVLLWTSVSSESPTNSANSSWFTLVASELRSKSGSGQRAPSRRTRQASSASSATALSKPPSQTPAQHQQPQNQNADPQPAPAPAPTSARQRHPQNQNADPKPHHWEVRTPIACSYLENNKPKESALHKLRRAPKLDALSVPARCLSKAKDSSLPSARGVGRSRP